MIHIIAKITAKAEHSETVFKELQGLINPSRAKDGCLQYYMYKDIKKSSIFYFVEQWENKEIFAKHMESELIKNYMKQTEGMIERLELSKVEPVPSSDS
ncbi:MAG: antibiotic biosynthesis monooxygenase [Flavobacteriales bacterium]|jgi:quinol monooxygenase YgiN|nr:antibiotic biosynthesis monooxygenase [Flavobacteriales bacterium]